MKLYSVHIWDINTREREEHTLLIVADSEDEAETKVLNDFYFDCAEAEEVTEIEGYRVIFEKLEG